MVSFIKTYDDGIGQKHEQHVGGAANRAKEARENERVPRQEETETSYLTYFLPVLWRKWLRF